MSNLVTTEFNNPDDCILGECLKVTGRKFKPVPNQNFVKIEGPGDCWIHKACSLSICQSAKCSAELLKNFKRFGFNIGTGFRKKDIIVEPAEGYDGPDYKGTNKHGAKAYSHTPENPYNVKPVGDYIFAIGYLDTNRQKRSGNIELVKIELTKEYSKN